MLSFVTLLCLWNSKSCPALAITGGGAVKVSAPLVQFSYNRIDHASNYSFHNRREKVAVESTTSHLNDVVAPLFIHRDSVSVHTGPKRAFRRQSQDRWWERDRVFLL
jgi:hypothetical protein